MTGRRPAQGDTPHPTTAPWLLNQGTGMRPAQAHRATPPATPGAASPFSQRHCLLHVSDLHFGTETPAVLQALLQWVRDHRPSGWVLTGDITQRATAAQFAQAKAFVQAMAGLGVPLLGCLPGNHDIPLFNLWQRFRMPYRRYTQAFGLPAVVPPVTVYRQPEVLLLMVKTTRRTRHERGELSDAQIQTVAEHLRAASPHQLRLVGVHQPLALRPAWAGGGMDPADVLIGAEHAMHVWAEAGCDAVLGGHAHLPYALRLPVTRPMWVLQAGTAISSRTRRGVPNSFACVCWEGPAPASAQPAALAAPPPSVPEGCGPSTAWASNPLADVRGVTRSARWLQWNHHAHDGFVLAQHVDLVLGG